MIVQVSWSFLVVKMTEHTSNLNSLLLICFRSDLGLMAAVPNEGPTTLHANVKNANRHDWYIHTEISRDQWKAWPLKFSGVCLFSVLEEIHALSMLR